jgi:quercetin dioxygenase-like cupin family protein
MSDLPRSFNWSELPTEQVLPGVTRQVVHGERQTMVRYVYAPGSVFPVHAHSEEQCTIVISGRIQFDIDGVQTELGPGGILVIPGKVPHGARVLGDEIVESFNALSPRRAANPQITNEPGDEHVERARSAPPPFASDST